MTFRLPFARIAMAGLLAGVLASCGTTAVSLDYQPSLAPGLSGARNLATGRFADMRGMGQYELGKVRTPIGTPMEGVRTNIPVAEVVRNAFAHGLSARQMLTSNRTAPYVISGEILQFYCDQVIRPGAYAKVRVNIINTATGQIAFSRVYQNERESGAYLPGTGSPVPVLTELASRALQEVVDRALDDGALRARLTRGATTPEPAY